MKKIKFYAMRIRNFKGLKEFQMVVNGDSADIYGDNAAGKTTLFDAFTWVLFGKNSQNQKAFQIKTLADGNEIRDLEHEVELQLLVDGQLVKLRKVLYEHKSSKATDDSFTDKIKLYIDDVLQKTQKAYDGFISTLVDEESFKLLTNPTFFSKELHWTVQREKLIEVCGGISDEDVIAANIKLKDLPVLLNGKSLDDRKTQVVERKKQLEAANKEVPAKISEAKRGLPTGTVDTTAERKASEQLLNEINNLHAQKATVTSGAAITNKQADIRALEIEINGYTQNFNTTAGQEVNRLKVLLQEKEGNLSIVQSKINQYESELNSKDYAIQQAQQIKFDAQTVRQQLLSKYKPLDESIYQHPQSDDTCPSCEQQLPKEQVDAAKAKAEEAFNLHKSAKLAEIKNKGLEQAARIKEMDQKLSILQNERAQIITQLEAAQAELVPHQQVLQKVQQQLQAAQTSAPDIITDAKYQSLISRKQALQIELQGLQEHASEVIADIDGQINALQQQKRDIDLKLASVVNVDAIYARIEELEQEQNGYIKELESMERIEYLIKEFETTKIRMLEGHINSKFKEVKFKLFDQQKDGKLVETCEVTHGGTAYNDLNTAQKINAGLDIIATLQQHYQVEPVVFIDNRESITKLYEMDNQVISLIVSEQDKELRVVSRTPNEQPTLFDEVV